MINIFDNTDVNDVADSIMEGNYSFRIMSNKIDRLILIVNALRRAGLKVSVNVENYTDEQHSHLFALGSMNSDKYLSYINLGEKRKKY